MDIWMWLQIVGAVELGAALAAAFGFALYTVRRREKMGLDPWHLPLGVALCGVMPPVVVAVAAYSLS